MRQLGLILAFAGLAALGCKTAPQPSPADASSPAASATGEPAQPAPRSSEVAPAPAASAEPAPAPGGERTYAEGTKALEVRVGERFAIALPANVTIPMKWRIDPPPDAKLLAASEEKYFEEPPKGCDGCTGYGGTRVFPFEAKAAGTTTLHFALRPLSDPKGKAQKETTIEVTIAP
jgi:predicted secreted protein